MAYRVPPGQRRVGHSRSGVTDQRPHVRARPAAARARRRGRPAGVVEGQRLDLGGRQAADVGYRVPLGLDADPVDDHRAADPGALLQCDLGGQPSSEGVADDGHVCEVELLQQRDVRPGKPGDGQAPGLRRAAEARVGGQQHPGMSALGEQVGEPGHRRRAAAAMQQQERPGAVPVRDSDLDRAGRVDLERAGADRPEGAGRDLSTHRSFSLHDVLYKEPYLRFII